MKNNKVIDYLENKSEAKYFFWIFFGFATLIFVSMIFISTKVGCVGDEWIDASNGKYALEYYLHGDTTFADFSKAEEPLPITQKYYGVGFEILPAIYIKMAKSSENEFLVRHLFCAFFGFLFLFFAALLAKELKNWKAAIATLCIMVCTPSVFGLSFFASKDIPTAAGFAIAIFGFVRFFRYLPKIRIMDVILSIVGIGLAISVRINGLLLPFYFGLFVLILVLTKKNLRTYYFKKPYKHLAILVLLSFAIVLCGVAIGFAFYPNVFHVGFLEHLKTSFEVMKKFPVKITMLYEGKLINSLELPASYKLNAYLYTIPLLAWIGMLLFWANSFRIFKKYDTFALIFIIFTLIFPLFYIGYTDANVYNSWRHTTFIYSSFAVLAAIGFYELYELMSRTKWNLYWKIGVIVIFLLAVFTPLKFTINNYKYIYTFYNGLVSNPYQEYDQEYSETSVIVAFEWLRKNELWGTDSVVISAKNSNLIHYQKNKKYENIDLQYRGFLAYAETECDYSILTMQFVPKKVLKKFFPPSGTIHVETIDGNPICAVVKRNKLDALGIKAIQDQRYQEAVDTLEMAYTHDPNNFGIWFYLGFGYYNVGKNEEAIEFFNKYLNFWPQNEQHIEYAKGYIGAAQVNLQQYEAAEKILLPLYNILKQEQFKPFVAANLGIAYYNLENYSQAARFLLECIPQFPHLRNALHYSYLKIGDHANAQKLLTKR